MSATAPKSAVAVALATFPVSAAPAGAAHQAALDLPVSATPCKLDTSSSYPSCGTSPYVVAIADLRAGVHGDALRERAARSAPARRTTLAECISSASSHASTSTPAAS